METVQNRCILILDRMVFDKIEFKRKGFRNDNEFNAELEAKVGEIDELECSVVTLILKGEKEDEYEIEISLTGYFSFSDDSITEETKSKLLGPMQLQFFCLT